jgi:hypothetical protein
LQETARLRVLEKKQLDSLRSKVSPQVSPQASPRRPVETSPTSSLQCGIMDGNRILESSLLMTTALEYRFGTVYDAWCFFGMKTRQRNEMELEIYMDMQFSFIHMCKS